MKNSVPIKVLVTGSHGFLGSRFVDFLSKRDIPYVIYDRKHPESIVDDIDTVVHFAGLTPVSQSVKRVISAKEYQRANVEGTRVLLENLSKRPNLSRFINIGSSAEYGFSPKAFLETVSPKPVGSYGESKLEQSKLVKAFAKKTGVKTFNLRIFNVAGLPQRSLKSRPPRSTLFETLLSAFSTGRKVVVKVSHPNAVRDYVDIDDIMEAVWRSLTASQGSVYEVVNICSGHGTSIKDLTSFFGTFFGKTYTLHGRLSSPNRSVGVPTKAKRILGWSPHTPLAESLKKITGTRHRVIIVGAGVAGREVVKEIRREKRNDIFVVGFVDDAPRKLDTAIVGLSVIGGIDDLPRIVSERDIDQVLVSVPSVGNTLVQRVAGLLPAGFSIKVLPSASSILLRRVDLASLRDIDISDLAGRPLVKADQEFISQKSEGKTFFITGGAGSIGSEIVRQLFSTNAKHIVIFDAWEEGVFNLSAELNVEGAHSHPKLDFYIGNVRDQERVNEIFKQVRPDVVIHAAAYKHVPLMEANPDEARKTNYLGTKNILDASVENGVKDFVLISTDKAVRPSSVMGKTKREAEILVKTYAQKHKGVRFMAVRFGNVLNSSGSVIPTFMRQIRDRKPITLTHRDMTRYFMAIPEAVSLVLLSWIVGKNGQILLLDMGEPIRILDLAVQLIRMHGLEPYTDIPIKEIGLRPGEKIHEELAYDVTKLKSAPVSRIFIAEDISS